MNKSTEIGKLAKALSAVQSQLKPAIKDANNPFFKSKYADLNSIWDCCRDLLADNSLAVTQVNQATENGVIIETVLMHESGEWISGEMFLPLTKQDAQGVGSAMTYGRRYGLAAILGIVADDDDDGNAAAKQTKPETKHVPIALRVEKAKAAIKALGVIPEAPTVGEAPEHYLASLSAQYKRLKEVQEGK